MEKDPSATVQANAATELITSGHVGKAVWSLAWPSTIQTFIQSAYMVINLAFVGRLPHADQSLAAVGIAGAALMVQFGVVVALSAGASALVSRSLGAGDIEGACEATRQSLLLCVIGGVVIGTPYIIWARPVVEMVGAGREVAPIAGDYTALIAWSSIPMFWWFIITTVIRSTGDAKTPLYIGLASLGINAVLDYILILGPGPFASYGVHGAAIATVVSRVVGAGLSFWFLGRSVLAGAMTHFRFHSDWCGRILRIGWPAAVGNIFWSTAFIAFLKVLAYLPGAQATAAQAAFTVGNRIEGFAFMPGIAYSMAATPLVGQNLGAGKPERAAHTAWVAVGQAAALMTVISISFLVAPRWLAQLFTTEAAVIGPAAAYLMINAPSEPFLALAMVLRGALQGAGDTLMPMVLSVTTLWVIRLPMTWLLSVKLGYGANGAWVAMSVTTVLSGLLIAAWFKWGTWRNRKV